jgi:hypothetical protein
MRIPIGKKTHVAAVTSSEVQKDTGIIFELLAEDIQIQIVGRFAPNRFHTKPPFCYVCCVEEPEQNGAGRTASAQNQTAASGTVEIIGCRFFTT